MPKGGNTPNGRPVAVLQSANVRRIATPVFGLQMQPKDNFCSMNDFLERICAVWMKVAGRVVEAGRFHAHSTSVLTVPERRQQWPQGAVASWVNAYLEVGTCCRLGSLSLLPATLADASLLAPPALSKKEKKRQQSIILACK